MSEEKYKICPVCGGRMWQGVSGNWLCGNCEAIEIVGGKVYKDRALMPLMEELSANPSVKFIPTFDWQAFRAEAAKDILCSMIQGNESYDTLYVIHHAVEMADELIKQLKDESTR